MADLIDSVADLIDVRDRDGLEATLARVVFEITGARALTYWRIFRRIDHVCLRRRVTLPHPGFDPPEAGEVPIAAAADALRMAFESRSVTRWGDRPRDSNGCVFPVFGASDVLGLLEVETDVDLDRHRMDLLSGMLRIYRSHLASLDYADTDELTGLANRRTFDDQFARFALAETRRQSGERIDDSLGARAHVGVADIDFFKQVNDRFGHTFGDEVLVLFSGLMRDTFREGDKLFRFGGEEFLVLMSNCIIDEALVAFERFRSAVEHFRFPQVGRVTVSIGVASLQPHDTGSAAFGRADQALYAAKRRGRNRVLLYNLLDMAHALESARPATPEFELF